MLSSCMLHLLLLASMLTSILHSPLVLPRETWQMHLQNLQAFQGDSLQRNWRLAALPLGWPPHRLCLMADWCHCVWIVQDMAVWTSLPALQDSWNLQHPWSSWPAAILESLRESMRMKGQSFALLCGRTGSSSVDLQTASSRCLHLLNRMQTCSWHFQTLSADMICCHPPVMSLPDANCWWQSPQHLQAVYDERYKHLSIKLQH